ncbi:MAG: hypothetical protein OXD31_06385 [Chloroflexi bacterium]|nr:hypothetical protein [Chloroflexota bacterium]
MPTTLFLEAFGQLSGSAAIDSREEDLYSVFRARGELMRWATTSNDSPLLWSMEEAEITADADSYRIGFVQVGLGVGDFVSARPSLRPVQGFAYAPLPVHRRDIEPALVLPALVQCFSDALRRFGSVELSGFQVTASGLESDAQSCIGYLVSVLNWFNTTKNGGADALIAFDENLLGSHTEAELVANLQWRNTGSFQFGPVVAVPEQHSIGVGAETPIRSISPAHSDIGIAVTLPEWTASAAGWVLASVVDAARIIEPDVSNFAVRLTRVR